MISTSCAWAHLGLRRTTASPMRTLRPNKAANPPNAPNRRYIANTARRCEPSKPPIAQQAPESTKTIPGPSWLWLEPIYEPFRAYGRVQQRRPYMTQFVSSLVIYFFGDMAAQSIAPAVDSEPEEVQQEEGGVDVEKGWVQEWSDNRDWSRTGRALVIGGLSSIPSYRWFLWLSGAFNYRSKILSLTTKVVVNQALFTPIFNTYFFGMQSLMSGATFSEAAERVRNTVPTSWINSCKIWPAITAFSFTFIPIMYRSIFGGVIAIGWQTYLSLLNQRAAKEEAMEHAHDQTPHATTVELRGRQGEKYAA